MKYARIFVAIALVASTSCVGAETKGCDTATEVDEFGAKVLELHTSDQLDAFEGCTALNGNIVIQSDYEGEFILNGVTELHGDISTAHDGAANLDLFEMSDLEEVDNIHLSLAGDVHLPKLNSTGDVELIQKSESGEIDLRSLTEADNVSIQGSWSSSNFSSLKIVTVACEFCGAEDCAIYGPDGKFPYIVVDLPSLEKADYFQVAGAVKSVSVPKLEVVGYIQHTESSISQGLRINIEEDYSVKLDFDAPKLHTLYGTLEVYGGVSSVSLGSLGKTSVAAEINTRTPLDFYSTLQTARYFRVWGEMHSIYLPDMDDLGDVDLEYSPRIPCNDTLFKLWEGQSENSSFWDDNNSCLDYDFPQEDEETNQTNTTTKPVPASADTTTPIPTASGAATHTGTTTAGTTETTSSGSSVDTATNKPDGPESASSGNGARQGFSPPLTSGTGLVIMTAILTFFYC